MLKLFLFSFFDQDLCYLFTPDFLHLSDILFIGVLDRPPYVVSYH